MDAICAEERDLGVGIDGVLGDMIDASRGELDEFEVGSRSRCGWEPGVG
jgi:hypothetical protein